MDKVIDIEERIPTLRDRRKKRSNRKFAGLLIILLLLLALLIYSQTPYSKIRSIDVSGEDLIEDMRYIEASGLAEGDSMWSFSPKDVEEKLEKLKWVKSASVDKQWLTSVAIKVEEYEKAGFLDEGNGYQPILSNGYVAEAADVKIDGPLLSGFTDAEIRQKLAEQLTLIDAEVYQLISEVIQREPEEEPERIALFMTDGNVVHGEIDSLAEKMNYYPSITAQLEDGQKGIIDVEVGVYFQSYADAYGTAEEGQEDEAVQE